MSKRFVSMALLAVIVLSLFSFALAEDAKKAAVPGTMPAMPEGMPPMGPPKELAACAGKVGTWDVVTDMRMDPTAEFTSSPGVCTFSMVVGGSALQSNYTSNIMGMPFEGLGLTSYNTGTSQWMTSWLDNMGGHMSIYTGNMVGENMVLTGKDVMAGAVWDTRITEGAVKDDKFNFQIEHSTDGGKTWAVFMKSVYTKRK